MTERQRYKHFFRCRSCGERFSVIRYTEAAEGLNPRCPRKACGGKSRESHVPDVGMDMYSGKAPGVVGANVQTKAYDAAMQITMQDQGMTDIQDHSRPGAVYRPGENTAPALPTPLQRQADAFWSGPQRRQPTNMKVDLSPIYGQPPAGQPRATGFTDTSLIDPILRAKPKGASAVPDHTAVASVGMEVFKK